MLDLWMGFLPVIAAAALSLSISLSPTIRQAILAIVCVLNANVILNCLGLDRPAGLLRYLIFPIRGKDLLFAKNVAVMVVVALQFASLRLVRGSLASCSSRRKSWWRPCCSGTPRMGQPCLGVRATQDRAAQVASGGDPVTTIVSALIGSAPGVAVIVLLQSDSLATMLSIAAIVLLTIAAYYGSLRYAGSSFERRIELISRRLA